jgi:hypothetical protein
MLDLDPYPLQLLLVIEFQFQLLQTRILSCIKFSKITEPIR